MIAELLDKFNQVAAVDRLGETAIGIPHGRDGDVDPDAGSSWCLVRENLILMIPLAGRARKSRGCFRELETRVDPSSDSQGRLAGVESATSIDVCRGKTLRQDDDLAVVDRDAEILRLRFHGNRSRRKFDASSFRIACD